MALINWSDQYCVKIQEFDQHHQRLVDIINRLHEAMKLGKAREVLGGILDELLDYTVYHFTAEEKVMQQFNFPGYLAQKGVHDKFIQRIREIKNQYLAGSVTLTLDVMQFLKDWLISHIQGMDQKYSDFLNKQGIK